MPPVSEAQRRAMQAAANGHSTLGIPKSVGKEFVGEDAEPPKGLAAGIVYVDSTGHVLLMKRGSGEENYPGHWALPGGKGEPGEGAEEAAEREAAEETGNEAPRGKRKLIQKVRTPGGFDFHTFAQPVDKRFWPRINQEHEGAGWFRMDDLPRPMHPAVRATLGDHLAHGVAEDMEPDDWDALRENFVKWTQEEEQEPEHAEDAVHAACHGDGCKACGWTGVANTNYWPMKPKAGAPPYSGAQDEWEEGKHPRADNGKFGSGSSSSKSKASAKKSGASAGSSSEPNSSEGTNAKPALKMNHLSKKGGKLGSNEGGLYEHPNGDKFYIKKPATKAHVTNERTAAKLYNLAGAKTLDYRDVEGGDHVATEWQQLEKKNIKDFTPAERKEAAQDFAIHCWLSNWDAAGTGGDNQGVLNGKTTTLDVGGSLRFRAQGGPKGEAFGTKVKEFDTMRDKGMSPDAAKLFAPMKESELKASVERVTSIPDDKIRETVGDDAELADTLIARKRDLAKRVGIAMDEKSYDFFENDDPEIAFAADGSIVELEMAFDRAPSQLLDIFGDFRRGLAYDKQSVRSYSKDGHLHVEEANISKACVNPYIGKEIPNWSELGLDPDKIYKLLRHPEELKKAASTFNGKPLLSEHVGVTSASHRHDITVGSVGTGVRYEHPYLKAPLSVWSQEDIDAIDSESERSKKKELSSAYHYRADMTPGNYEGEEYDGVMRDIVGNHVALVKEGRAGSDVVVGDAKNPLTEGKFDMTKKALLSQRASVARGALMVHLQPLLAKDAQIDIGAALKGVTDKNFKTKKPAIVSSIEKQAKGKLIAADGSIKEGLEGVLSMIEGLPEATPAAEDEDMDDDDPAEDEANEDETDEERDARLAAAAAAKDEDPATETEEERKKRLAAARAAQDKENVTPKAMDAAISKAVADERKRGEAISAAKEHVRPRVGVISIACDSAEQVYLHALKLARQDVKPFAKADASTLKGIFDLLPADKPATSMAQDSAVRSSGSKLAISEERPGLAKNLSRIGR
jgi:8-oxo-dGTP pyrophosphatase MutT (NUDIX family)